MNYDKNLLVVHSKMPKKALKSAKASKFELRYINNRPFIQATLLQDGVKNKNWFLFDTGYQRTAMLDADLLKAEKFPSEKMEIIKKVMMHGTANNEIPVITAKLQELKLGTHTLRNVPAQLLETNKPMRGVNIHILGSEVLKRFNTYIDLQHNFIYLVPNQLFDLPYADQQKS